MDIFILNRGYQILTQSAAVQDKPLPSIASLRRIMQETGSDLELCGPDSPPLEVDQIDAELPRLLGSQLIEGTSLQRRDVGDPVAAVNAFLDGKQHGDYLGFEKGVPVFAGTVGAVVRLRENGRATTWELQRRRVVVTSKARIPTAMREALGGEAEVIDTDEERANQESAAHPMLQSWRAWHIIQRRREKLETELAQTWIAKQRGDTLLVDGGISTIPALGASPVVIGVVKTHRTMYVQDRDVATVLALAEGERSTAFQVETRGDAVASWYLRLRRERGRDPLWGLVRLECALDGFSSERADEISRWVLAERSPVSLPDSRWDRLLYGIRDCEMFLSAVL